MAVAKSPTISCPFAQGLADLIQVALFICLRLCKYTRTILLSQTVQFCFKDVKFHNAYRVIPHNDPPKNFLRTWAATYS